MLLAETVAADEAAAAQKKAAQGQSNPLDMLNKIAAMYAKAGGQGKGGAAPAAGNTAAVPANPNLYGPAF